MDYRSLNALKISKQFYNSSTNRVKCVSWLASLVSFFYEELFFNEDSLICILIHEAIVID